MAKKIVKKMELSNTPTTNGNGFSMLTKIELPPVTRFSSREPAFPLANIPVGGGLHVPLASTDKEARTKLARRINSARFGFCRRHAGYKFAIRHMDHPESGKPGIMIARLS